MGLLIFAVGAETHSAKYSTRESGGGARNRCAVAGGRSLTGSPEPFSFSGNEYRQFLADGVAVVFENRVALAVARAIGVVFANGLRRGASSRRRFVVAQVDDFGLRIGDRIVVPGSQPVGLAVACAT